MQFKVLLLLIGLCAISCHQAEAQYAEDGMHSIYSTTLRAGLTYKNLIRANPTKHIFFNKQLQYKIYPQNKS